VFNVAGKLNDMIAKRRVREAAAAVAAAAEEDGDVDQET
jgi:hypothetical protein